MQSNHKNIIVIGAGPAGLMAAGQATKYAAKVIVLEKMPSSLIKLSLTGNGRCNITNAKPILEFEKAIWTNFRFLKHALMSFKNIDLRDFFADLGIKTVVEAEDKVFPASGKALDICQALIAWANSLNVKIMNNFTVTKIVVKDNKICGIEGSDTLKNAPVFLAAEAIILATGGSSYPKTGSTGDGYRLAKALGHNIIPVKPSLVPLETQGTSQKDFQGTSLKNIGLSLWVDNKKMASYLGDVLFTHFGVSGPGVLALSHEAANFLDPQNIVTLKIDLFPSIADQMLDQALIKLFMNNPKQQIANTLKNSLVLDGESTKLLPPKMLMPFLANLGIPADKLISQISAYERKKIRLGLKNFTLEIKNTRPLAEALITAGGVDVKEIDSKTLGSKLIEGLYFAGEIIDVDADTGGYNLQIAFSTGWLAGKSV